LPSALYPLWPRQGGSLWVYYVLEQSLHSAVELIRFALYVGSTDCGVVLVATTAIFLTLAVYDMTRQGADAAPRRG